MRETAGRQDGDGEREAFMAKFRAALEHGRTAAPSKPAPPVDEAIARLAGPRDDLLEMFTLRAEEVGMTVHRIPDDQLPGTRSSAGNRSGRR